jgi:magnesium transporter
MVKYYVKNADVIEVFELLPSLKKQDIAHILWLDISTPSEDEIAHVEKTFNITLPTKQESEEIEMSSRYWEEENHIEINSFFLIDTDKNPQNETVSFFLQENILISIRTTSLKSFDEFSRKIVATPLLFESGYDVFSHILDIRIDIDADVIEKMSQDIARLRKHIFADYVNHDDELLIKNDDILEKISLLEELNMKIRENLNDKQRILSSFLKSTKCKEAVAKEVEIMLKDIKSLIEYTDFNFERIENLQNIFFGLLTVEQNKIIKIFAIMNVIFLPPTLVASIYGMNFDFMPELKWKYGYLLSIAVMIATAVLPLYFFRRKNWI